MSEQSPERASQPLAPRSQELGLLQQIGILIFGLVGAAVTVAILVGVTIFVVWIVTLL